VFVFKFGEIVFPQLVLPQEEDRGFGKGPAQMHVANLFPGGPKVFAGGFFGALHQATIRDEVLDTRKPRDVLNLISDDEGQDLSDPWDGWEPREGLPIMCLGTSGDIEFHFAE